VRFAGVAGFLLGLGAGVWLELAVWSRPGGVAPYYAHLLGMLVLGLAGATLGVVVVDQAHERGWLLGLANVVGVLVILAAMAWALLLLLGYAFAPWID